MAGAVDYLLSLIGGYAAQFPGGAEAVGALSRKP